MEGKHFDFGLYFKSDCNRQVEVRNRRVEATGPLKNTTLDWSSGILMAKSLQRKRAAILFRFVSNQDSVRVTGHFTARRLCLVSRLVYPQSACGESDLLDVAGSSSIVVTHTDF